MAPTNHNGGLKLVLPSNLVPEEVHGEFGRVCQLLDESLGNVHTTTNQRALIKFLRAHLDAQLALIDLASASATVAD
jgi:hypothetical protein